MTQTEFFNFSSLYNRASADVPFLFSPGLTEVPRKSGPACCSFRPFFTSSTSFPFNALSPCSPRTPNSTQRKPSTVSSWGLREAAEPPGSRVGRPGERGTCSPPAAEQLRPGPAETRSHLPGVAWDSLATHLRLRSGPLARPPRRAGDASPRAAEEGRCPSASRGPATPDSQGVRACGGGQRPGLDRLRGRTGSESWAIPRDCAARSGGQVGARGGGTGPAPRPAQPSLPRCGGRRAVASARTADPGVRPRPWGRRAAEHAFPSGIEEPWLLRSDLSRRPELASNSPSSWLKSLLTRGVWPPP